MARMKHLISLLLLVTFTMHSQEDRRKRTLIRFGPIGRKRSVLLSTKRYWIPPTISRRSALKKVSTSLPSPLPVWGNRADKKQLARSLSMLGEVYQYHNQLDLAIASYKDALAANKTMGTALLLGKTYLLNANYREAESLLKPLLEQKTWIPYQQVAVYELLGDAYLGQGETAEAVAYYEQGLKIAELNRIATKLADLNSKIADAFAKEGKSVEAEGFYGIP